ncbi:hypothetical protein GZ77_13890 [Endozoicomonas montiporae]|uniref:Uncharacterized protein n=1 Tax=Endozoicomonas montiporae TaxID=1027273 RepID=A0A081N4T6_9GAMM|nr:hypothetical protein [Endozoicomonas montiporae]KEQ13459.1 hypothetical protein GZ77_13890 [Endozoicomonas montiporae]
MKLATQTSLDRKLFDGSSKLFTLCQFRFLNMTMSKPIQIAGQGRTTSNSWLLRGFLTQNQRFGLAAQFMLALYVFQGGGLNTVFPKALYVFQGVTTED